MGKAAAAHLLPNGLMPSRADPDMKQGLRVQTKCKAALPRKYLETHDAKPTACLTEWHHALHIGSLLRKENQTNRECKLFRVATAVSDGFARLEPCMQNL